MAHPHAQDAQKVAIMAYPRLANSLLWALAPFGLLWNAVTPLSGGQALSSPLWCRHTILLYAQPAAAAPGLTTDQLRWLVCYRDQEGTPRDLFFDGFLILGFSAKGGRYLLTAGGKPAIQSDWSDAIAAYLGTAQRLSQAFEEVGAPLGRPEATGKVILAIPYPDPRQREFGMVEGRLLDFTRPSDREAAVRWYLDEALRQWNAWSEDGRLKKVRLVGFYWSCESIPPRDTDLVRQAADLVHQRGLLLHWIPSFGGARKDWRELGLDCVTQQINYQNPQKPGRPLTIFSAMDRVAQEYGLHGVEMTPVAREAPLNPRLFSWHQVFLANLEAALRLNWQRFPAITYFHGGDLAQIAANPQTVPFYEGLYRWMKGTFTPEDLLALSEKVLDELARRGHLTDEQREHLVAQKTVWQRLEGLEAIRLAQMAQAEREKLAPFRRASENLVHNGGFEEESTFWSLSAGASRSQEVAHSGGWSLRLASGATRGTDFIHTYAKSAHIPVQRGQVVRLSAWLWIPSDLRETQRGVVIGLSRFREGARIADWNECQILRTSKTDTWQRVTLHLFVDDLPCDAVEVMLGLCGVGTAYLDDVELVTLTR